MQYKGSRKENPSHRGEKLDCEILEVAARLLKDTARAEYMGYIAKCNTRGSPMPANHCGSAGLSQTSGDGICCLGIKTVLAYVRVCLVLIW